MQTRNRTDDQVADAELCDCYLEMSAAMLPDQHLMQGSDNKKEYLLQQEPTTVPVRYVLNRNEVHE